MGNPPPIPKPVIQIAQAIALAGGRTWIVGGWVRDYLLGRSSKDVDIEVSGLSFTQLHDVLSNIGPVRAVGRSFPIFKFHHSDYEIDLALPRKHSHPDGTVEVDPNLSLKESARGRDLRLNAMALDPLSGELSDPFGGQQDLNDQVLRAVDITRFGEDPLRVIRVARFAAQLNFQPDAELEQCAKEVNISDVASERIGGELWKIFTAPYPIRGVKTGCRIEMWSRLIEDVNFNETNVEIAALERWAPHRSQLGSPTRAVTVALGILLHPLSGQGLENTLNRLDIHRKNGLDMRAELLCALTRWRELSVRHDDAALKWASEQGELAISLGIARALEPKADLTLAWNRARELGILFCPLMPLVLGRDLIELGFSPGKGLGQVLHHIRAAQLDGRISTPEEAIQLAKNELTPFID